MSITIDDYRRAEQFLPWNAITLCRNLRVTPHWLPDGDRFWYQRDTRDGHEVIVVEPDRARSTVAFDHEQLAATLSKATGQSIGPGSISTG